MNKVFTTIGASNHSLEERLNEDYYATDPKAMELLLNEESFNTNIWECACGEKHLANVLKNNGYNVRCSDIINRCNNEVLDFLSPQNSTIWNGDIITNPPYKCAKDFVIKALSLLPNKHKLALFLKLTFLEGKNRKLMFIENPPKVLYVSSSRLLCAKNGIFENSNSSAVAYAWYVWEKGYKGNAIIKWIN